MIGWQKSVPVLPEHVEHAYYKCDIFVVPEKLKSDWNRDRIMHEIQKRGVPCSSGPCSEIYLEKTFDNLRPEERLPNAKKLGETSLMFMVHPTLTKDEIEKTCSVVEEVLRDAQSIIR